MRLLRVLESLACVLERLPRQLVPGLMILLSMMYCGGSMRMGSKLVEFRGSLVGVAGHDVTSLWNYDVHLNFSSTLAIGRHWTSDCYLHLCESPGQDRDPSDDPEHLECETQTSASAKYQNPASASPA